MAAATFHAARLVARLRKSRLATVVTETSYALCARHARRWRAGGWSGHMTAMSPEEVTLTLGVAGSALLECADCQDETDPDWEGVACTSCGKIIDPLAVFPGAVCLDCWAATPEGRYVPTAAQLVQMWGGKP